tara:strand:- start:3596 stop:4240 length:645 start_codon:yes stop_codon:yes gene_type:complete
MSKTAIWDALGKTDPSHTKRFSRAGGFKGTATKPIWVYRRLTEQFGPVGEGWGHSKPDFQVVPGANDEVLVYCTVECWHTDRRNGFFGVGGDKAVAKNKNGLFSDDEAFKKAFTDAVMNAFKSVGVAADVHMGLFDDDKYVAQMDREFSPPPPTLSDEQREKLVSYMYSLKFPAYRLLSVSKIKDLRELPAAKFDGAMKWIADEAKKLENADAQ